MAAGAKGAQRSQRSETSAAEPAQTRRTGQPHPPDRRHSVRPPAYPPRLAACFAIALFAGLRPSATATSSLQQTRPKPPMLAPSLSAEPRRVTCRLSTGKPRQRHADRHSPLPDALSGQLGTGLLSPLVRLVRLRADPQRHGGCRRSGTPEHRRFLPAQSRTRSGRLRLRILRHQAGIRLPSFAMMRQNQAL